MHPLSGAPLSEVFPLLKWFGKGKQKGFNKQVDDDEN